MLQGQKKRDCPDCYFSRVLGDNLHCLKNPPGLNEDTGEARWPIVKKDDVCGQFRYVEQNHIEAGCGLGGELPIYRDRGGDYCKIPLTQGRFAKVDPEDYIRLSQFRWHCKVNKNAIYAVRTEMCSGRSKRIYMHCVIANTPPNLVCDHINHSGLDNRKTNLRNCTIQQNNANSRSAASASSKYKGVCWNKKRKKWYAYIKKDGVQYNLGCFTCETAAARAYDAAAKRYHGEFAALNFGTLDTARTGD